MAIEQLAQAKSPVFYQEYARKSDLQHQTHYCPGCGHGLAQRYLADAIEELGVQDRTVAISPVGCSVFLYYYLDVGNIQAAHAQGIIHRDLKPGNILLALRREAVALGHKLAHPGSLVVSYQGDGDLASIGLAEILQAAQLGTPLAVIFVNNAIYGMTGGQLAPTTLLGQRTSTSPYGRDAAMGRPLRMAELIAALDGPVYVERVALFDARQRVRAQKARKRPWTSDRIRSTSLPPAAVRTTSSA